MAAVHEGHELSRSEQLRQGLQVGLVGQGQERAQSVAHEEREQARPEDLAERAEGREALGLLEFSKTQRTSKGLRPILKTLVDALRPSVDIWLAETLSAIAEARLVREVLGGADPKPLWLSFTLEDGRAEAGKPRLRSGEPVGEAVQAALELGAAAVLFNCSQPEVMANAVDAARAVLTAAGRAGADGVRVGVYANAFVPQRVDAQANSGYTEVRADLDPPGYLQWAADWVSRGASVVGGCCGIGPEHIAELSKRLPRA